MPVNESIFKKTQNAPKKKNWEKISITKINRDPTNYLGVNRMLRQKIRCLQVIHLIFAIPKCLTHI